MQVFLLALPPQENAVCYMDKHVVKTVPAIQQLLVNALAGQRIKFPSIRQFNGMPLLPLPSISNNPFCKWARVNFQNYEYLRTLALELCAEYQFRTRQPHYCLEGLKQFPVLCSLNLSLVQWERYPWMIPMMFQDKRAGVIDSYRKYYVEAKQHLAEWTVRGKPLWYPQTAIDQGVRIREEFQKAKKKQVVISGVPLKLIDTENPNAT